MPVLRTSCPECGAGLKSQSGFTPGQTVCCPKCETYFVVEDSTAAPKATRKAMAADDDYDDDRPRKKKRAADDGTYKNSPIRYVILAILLVVLGVLGYMLYQKKQKEKEDNADGGPGAGNRSAELPTDLNKPLPPPPVGVGAGGGGGGGARPPRPPIAPEPKTPMPGTGGAGAIMPDLPLFGGAPTGEAAKKMTDALTTKLAGAWQSAAYKVEYKADGTYTETVGTGEPKTGKWEVVGLVGTKGLKLNRTGGGKTPVNVVFEGEELVHDTAANNGSTFAILKK